VQHYFRLAGLTAALTCGLPLAAQPGSADRSSPPGTEYALVELGPMPDVSEAPSGYGLFEGRRWQWAEQIETTNAATGGELAPPLVAGWIDLDTYVRVEAGRVVYLTRTPVWTTGKDATHLCRITVDIERVGGVPPDLFQDVGVADCTPPNQQMLARVLEANRSPGLWRTTAQTVLESSDGDTLFVRHRAGRIGSVDRPPAGDTGKGGIRTYYRLPTQYGLASSLKQRTWIIEHVDGTFELAVRFDLEGSGSNSGCLLRDRQGSFPRENWITPDLWRWCGEHDRLYAAPS
jgi:hypothetical protein